MESITECSAIVSETVMLVTVQTSSDDRSFNDRDGTTITAADDDNERLVANEITSPGEHCV